MKRQFIVWAGAVCMSLSLAGTRLTAAAQDQSQGSSSPHLGSTTGDQAQQSQGQQSSQGQGQQPAGQQGAQQGGQQGQPAQPPQPQIDPQEEAAYKAFFDLKGDDPDQLIKAGEDFLQKYPDSRYTEGVYSRLTMAYFQKNELDKMYTAGDKALSMNPDDIDVLSLVGWVIPHTYDPDDPDAPRRLEKAEQYSKHAIELLGNLQKPDAMTDEDFAKVRNSKLAQSHSGLGLVYFRLGLYEESVTELQTATQLDTAPDPTDYFVMGINLQQMKKFDDAAQAFDKCGQMEGSLQDRCKASADNAKKASASQAAAPKQ